MVLWGLAGARRVIAASAFFFKSNLFYMSEINLPDLAAIVAPGLELKPGVVKEISQAVFDAIGPALAEHGRVEIVGFGVFYLAPQDPRSGVAPNGQRWETPARNRITFHASPALASTVAKITEQETY